jgi:hypothetical protein
MTSDKGNSTPHNVLVKIIQHQGEASGGNAKKSQRIGNVLMVTESAPLSQTSIGDMAVGADRVVTTVRIVTSDSRLSPDRHERVTKRAIIGDTLIETIDVGIAVPSSHGAATAGPLVSSARARVRAAYIDSGVLRQKIRHDRLITETDHRIPTECGPRDDRRVQGIRPDTSTTMMHLLRLSSLPRT